MFLSKDYFEFYSSLPKEDKYWQTRFWIISVSELENLFNTQTIAFERIWQAQIFSLFKKILYTYSPSNYSYVNHYFQWKYNAFQSDNIVYREKFKYFFEIIIPNLSPEIRNTFIQYSETHLEHFSAEFINLFFHFENDVFQYPFTQDLKDCLLAFDLKEEFSDQPGAISHTFYQNILQIIRNKQSV
jgi:hypothetical protein